MYKEGESMAGTVKVSNLHVSYHGKEVVSNISFEFKTHKLIGVIGPNGAGKSTLMKASLGLIPRDKGEVTFDGKKVDKISKDIAYVPQRSDIDWYFSIKVIDTFLIGSYHSLFFFRLPDTYDYALTY